jgi:nuclease S1
MLMMPFPALSWGFDGHRVIAEIALSRLAPNVLAEVQDLVGDFAGSATWADEIVRQRRETAPWHYVNFPAGATYYESARDCKDDDCAVARILSFTRILGDRALEKQIRAEALKFLIHFVGDIHQPLHASYASDRGGNEVWAHIGGRTERLHSWWDSDLFESYWGKDRAGAIAECNAIEIQSSWLQSKPEDWANESFKITREVIYSSTGGANTRNTPILLPDVYAHAARPIITLRLLMAGVRLAATINEALSKGLDAQ